VVDTSEFCGEQTTLRVVLASGDLWCRYNNMRDEKYLRRVVMPLELILTNYPRIVVKDPSWVMIGLGFYYVYVIIYINIE
jgi:hypothetical protein